MKATDLTERTDADLKDLEKVLSTEKFTSRFRNFTNRLDDTSKISKAKRDLARVKTVLRQRALVGARAGLELGSKQTDPGVK